MRSGHFSFIAQQAAGYVGRASSLAICFFVNVARRRCQTLGWSLYRVDWFCHMWQNVTMMKTQIQIPDQLYQQAKAIAEQREWSLAEVFRRGIEQMTRLYPVVKNASGWQLPCLKGTDFVAEFDQLDLKALAEADEIRVRP